MATDVVMYEQTALLNWLASVESEMHGAGRHAQAQGVRSIIARIKRGSRGRFPGATTASKAQADRDADEGTVARLEAEIEVQDTLRDVRTRLQELVVRTRRHRVGELMRHYKPILEQMTPGTSELAPYGDHNRRDLRGAISAWISKHWGKGAGYTTTTDQGVGVMRLF